MRKNRAFPSSAFRKFRTAMRPAARRRAICEQEIKLNFARGGPGDTSRKRCYLSPPPPSSLFPLCPRSLFLSLLRSIPRSVSFLSSNAERGANIRRMKFGFEVNPLVRNQSRPHRITRVATENGFRDFKRLPELRFTERRAGKRERREKEFGKCSTRGGIERYREIFQPQTKANFIHASRWKTRPRGLSRR